MYKHYTRGVTLFQKVGVPKFSFRLKVWKSRNGAFWWISDAFWRTLVRQNASDIHQVVEVVVCCAQDAARLCDQFCQFFSDGMQVMGVYSPIAPDKLRPCLPTFSSTRFYFPPFLFISFSFLAKLTRCSCCGLFTVMYIMGLHLSRSMIRLKIEVLNDF